MIDHKKELESKIKLAFSSNDALLNYLIETKKNFLYRYLETSTDHNIEVVHTSSNLLIAESFEPNLGLALKILDPEIKAAVKTLAKSTPREANPKIMYRLKTEIKNLTPEHGEILFESTIHWNFPHFTDEGHHYKSKKSTFTYQDIADYRKNLALKLEEVCELFN